MLRRVLIANRGEIAVRIIRACREMGIATVVVYSDADADAPHVAAADEKVAIGPAPATESYLNIPNILDAAAKTGADAIHPGYGFLSENARFAHAVEDAGLAFIGPPARVIEQMGSKIAAREIARAAGVPVVPGETPASQSREDLAAAVARVGLPALLKASSGGGGKGMRIVRTQTELEEAIDAARREGERAFADGALYVERLIEDARHIEVQVFADTHGHAVHLFERDCTLQRRHQKVIEETPGPTMTPVLRERMTSAALALTRAVGYVNAGTIEFLLHGAGDRAEFYFLEMNTRLQVEHPITEAVTGQDLVKAQLRVAAGEPLPFTQADLTQTGHAVECRIYAEDPAHGMLPQAGTLLRYREPSGEGVRVDSGVREGQTITVHYDPMLAKLIAYGPTRQIAFTRVAEALRQFEILGLRHNISFLRRLAEHPSVAACRTHTRFIEAHLDELTRPPAVGIRQAAAAAAAAIATRVAVPIATADDDPLAFDPWRLLGPVNW